MTDVFITGPKGRLWGDVVGIISDNRIWFWWEGSNKRTNKLQLSSKGYNWPLELIDQVTHEQCDTDRGLSNILFQLKVELGKFN